MLTERWYWHYRTQLNKLDGKNMCLSVVECWCQIKNRPACCLFFLMIISATLYPLGQSFHFVKLNPSKSRGWNTSSHGVEQIIYFCIKWQFEVPQCSIVSCHFFHCCHLIKTSNAQQIIFESNNLKIAGSHNCKAKQNIASVFLK